MIDRYSKVVLTVIALSLVSFVLKPWVMVPRANAGWNVGADAIAAKQKELANPTVPRSWGRFVAVEHHPTASNLRLYYFEAQDGTIRTRSAAAIVELTRN